MINELGHGKFTTKIDLRLIKGDSGRFSVWSINQCSLSNYCAVSILLSVTPVTENLGSRNYTRKKRFREKMASFISELVCIKICSTMQ